jgi:glycosyltransferase involved in cell wall biosynthesis
VLIAGEDRPAYGPPPALGASWQTTLLDELRGRLDPRRIHFLGWLDTDALRRLYQVSATHVYLSYPFVASWSLYEAMACGAALIGSDTGPVRELVEPDRTGVLADFFSPDALAQAVLALLADPARRRRLGTTARARMVERHDFISVVAPRFERLIDDLVNRRAPAG